jgi:hypothetical protein
LLGPGGYAGRVVFDSSRIPINPPQHFHDQLQVLELTLTREKEAANRIIIAHFICHAIMLTRHQFGAERVVCASDLEVPGELISNVGFVLGTLDFAIVKLKGRGKIGVPRCYLSC